MLLCRKSESLLYKPSFNLVIKESLDQFQFFFNKVRHIEGKVSSVLIGIYIKPVEAVIFPVAVVVLDPVLPEIHLHPVIELTAHMHAAQCQQE